MTTLEAIFLACGPCFSGLQTGFSTPSQGSPAKPVPYSVIFTEIMADPSPSQELPDAEYLEIFNRSDEAVNLEGWSIHVGQKSTTLPSARLDAGSYIILCDADNSGLFLPYGNVTGLKEWPALINTGSTLVLFSPAGEIIHCVVYADTWNDSSGKKGGGWSLEMTDTENPCGQAENWQASRDRSGGTPGRENSVKAINPDLRRPDLLRATYVSENTIMLHFNESMEEENLVNPMHYYGSPDLMHPLSATSADPLHEQVDLTFSIPFHPFTGYVVTALNTLTDCAGNALNGNASAEFAIPEKADSFDVVINEILFDAREGQAEFAELYNRSAKVIDLAGFCISIKKEPGDTVAKPVPLLPFLLLPDHYALVTRQPELLSEAPGAAIMKIPAFRKLPDDGGTIEISDSGRVIDRLCYSPAWHSAFIHRTEGLSLERIDPDLPTTDEDNWLTSSAPEGYATPGYANAQKPASDGTAITVFPALFSPDGDGTDDLVFLDVLPDHPDCLAEAAIFNRHGRKICILWNAEFLGAENVVSWDGTLPDGKPASPDIYVIYIQIYDTHGIVKNYKKVITLARRVIN